MGEVFRIFFMLIVASFCTTGCDSGSSPAAVAPDSGLPIAVVTIRPAEGGAPTHVDAEVVSTTAQRQQGLMFREEMAENRGMLFLFPRDTRGGFWMRNTLIPLSIAYIGADGTIQEIREGKPQDDTILVPDEPYRYVLEMNSGWFERHSLGVGDTIELPPGLPVAQ